MFIEAHRDGQVPRRGRDRVGRRREHRLDHGHRLPGLVGRRPAVHQRLRRRPPGFVARARELAETYGERFTPPESLVARAEAGEPYFDGEVLAAACKAARPLPRPA